MKRIFIVIAVLICSQNVSAQLFSKEKVQNLQNFDKPRFSWGYILGLNSYDFNFDYTSEFEDADIVVDNTIGFSVGLLGNMRINDYLDLRLEPMVTFTSRNLTFSNPLFTSQFESFREVKSTYVHVPLLLKVSTKRLNNFKPFIVGGVSTSINLSSNEDNPDDNSSGEFRMKTNTNYFELGFGIDFYLYYFKFTPSIRGIFAMSDELVQDNDPDSPWTSTIDKMSTRGIFINFTFQ
ncbi:porin family protein [Aquimarina spongiae]|uniref:Probable protein-translocating porin PorT n=1 Tax=Aquimarina spongiae TaxID=570521 RepID=A0A1M6L0E5_9FLAO|nr:porin family protein [Aquimarina spongiae]SHJ64735.1 probable protein-translocating porin PorT [Aquimarina spongiae]